MYVTCVFVDRELQARRQSRRGRRTPTGKIMSTLRSRPRTCKRTRRAARMAAPPAATDRSPRYPAAPPPGAARSSVFISTYDWNDGCLVYGVRLEPAAPPSSSDDPTTPAMQILRPSGEPVVCWSEEQHKLSALAAVSGGATILALVAGSRETVVHDVATGADAPGPRLRRSKRHPAMLPVGDGGDTVLVMDMELRRPGRCCFEALRRSPGGGWRAEALPDPPAAFLDDDGITGYFAMGSRAWISVAGKGTLSLDTAETGTSWRVEGTWELPLSQRGIFVPELGVVIGIPRSLPDEYELTRCVEVCALDVEAGRPPVVRHVLDIPPPECIEATDMPRSPGVVSLAYLGNGRLCVARSVNVEVLGCDEKGTSFTLVDVSRLPGGDLELAKHGKAHCHVWPYGHTGHATFLQPV